MMVQNYEGVDGTVEFIQEGFERKIKVYSANAITIGCAYVLGFGTATPFQPIPVAVASLAVYQYVGLVYNLDQGPGDGAGGILAGTYGYLKLRGIVENASGSSITAGHFVKATNGATALSDDGTTRTTASIGRALTADSGGFFSVLLFGDRVIIA